MLDVCYVIGKFFCEVVYWYYVGVLGVEGVNESVDGGVFNDIDGNVGFFYGVNDVDLSNVMGFVVIKN